MKRWIKAVAIGGVASVLLYLVVGFYLLPYLIKHFGTKIAKERYETQLSVEVVEFNPLRFTLNIQNLSLTHQKGPLLKLGSLQTEFHPRHLFKNKAVISHLHLDGLKLYPTINKSRLNFVTIFANEKAVQPSESDKQSSFTMQVDALDIEDSYIYFTDEDAGYKKDFGPLNLGVQNFSTEPNSVADASAKLMLGGFGSLDATATFGLDPLNLNAHLVHKQFDLSKLYYFFDEDTAINSGILEYATNVAIKQSGDSFATTIKDLFVSINAFDANYDNNYLQASKLQLDQKSLSYPSTKDTKLRSKQLQLTAKDFSLDTKDAGFFTTAADIQTGKISIDSFDPLTIFVDVLDIHSKGGSKLFIGSDELAFYDAMDLHTLNLYAKLSDNPAVTTGGFALGFKQPTLYDSFITDVKHPLESIKLKTEAFSLDKPFFLDLKVDAKDFSLQNSSKIDLQNSSYSGELLLTDFNLLQLRPYMKSYVYFDVKQGSLQLDTHYSISQKMDDTSFTLYANILAKDLQTIDKGGNKLADLNSLDIKNLQLTNTDMRIKKIALQGLDSIISINDAGSNFDNLIVQNETKDDKDSGGAIDFSIDLITIDESKIKIDYKNSFIFSDIDATLSPLNKQDKSTLNLELTVDQFGKLGLDMEFIPFDFQNYTQASGYLHGLNLQKLSPYAYPSLGRNFTQGRLHSDFTVTIIDSMLDSEFDLRIHSLSVSPHDPDSGASRLPMNLAIALLKNRDDVINLNLFAKDDINDPRFSVTNVIPRVITNAITNTVRSPFAVLGSLVGVSARELSHVDFEYTKTELSMDQLNTLDSLVQALIARPQLHIGLIAGYDKEKETHALKAKKLSKHGIYNVAEEKGIDTINLDEKEVQKKLMQIVSISQKDLENLASLRLDYIYSYLLSHGIDSSRIDKKEEFAAKSAKVEFTLSQ